MGPVRPHRHRVHDRGLPRTRRLATLDLRLLRALQIDGRASFSRIGAVLGVSDRTVARRFQRLCTLANLRVVGMTDDRRPGGGRWVVRLGCVPDAAESLADTPARRPDTVYVAVASGGTEVVCGVRVGDGLVLDRLQLSARVTSVSAHCLLRFFYRGPLGRVHRIAALTPEQEASLRLSPVEPSDRPTRRPASDDVLLAALRRDGRVPLTELGQVTGQSESAVRRRLEGLRSAGVLHYTVQLDHEQLDHGFRVLLWLTVAPAHLTRVGHELVGHHEVSFAAAVTGDSNIVVSTHFAPHRELYAYLISGIRGVEGIAGWRYRPSCVRSNSSHTRRGGSRRSSTPCRRPGVPRCSPTGLVRAATCAGIAHGGWRPAPAKSVATTPGQTACVRIALPWSPPTRQ